MHPTLLYQPGQTCLAWLCCKGQLWPVVSMCREVNENKSTLHMHDYIVLRCSSNPLLYSQIHLHGVVNCVNRNPCLQDTDTVPVNGPVHVRCRFESCLRQFIFFLKKDCLGWIALCCVVLLWESLGSNYFMYTRLEPACIEHRVWAWLHFQGPLRVEWPSELLLLVHCYHYQIHQLLHAVHVSTGKARKYTPSRSYANHRYAWLVQLCYCCCADKLQEMLTKEAGLSLTDEERTYKDKLRQRHWEKAILLEGPRLLGCAYRVKRFTPVALKYASA